MSCSRAGNSQYISCLAEQFGIPVADAREIFHAEKARAARETGDAPLTPMDAVHRFLRASTAASAGVEDSDRAQRMTQGVKDRLSAMLSTTYGATATQHPKWALLSDPSDPDPAGTLWDITSACATAHPDATTPREAAITASEMSALESLPGALAVAAANGRCPNCGQFVSASGHTCPNDGDTPPPPAPAPAAAEATEGTSYWDQRAIDTYGVPLRNVAEDDYFTPAATYTEGSRILIVNADDGGMRTLAESEELPQTAELGETVRTLATTPNGEPGTREQQLEAILALKTASNTMREHVDAIEDDLTIRARALGISDIHDRITGLTINRGSGYNYSGWNSDGLASEIADKADFGDEITRDEAAAVIREYRTFATPDRFRTSALRDIGIDARQYATAQYRRPTLNPRWVNEDQPSVGNGTATNILNSQDTLASRIEALPDAREQIRTMPFDVAVREYAALRAQQRLLNNTAEQMEALTVASMNGESVTVNGYTVTAVAGRPNVKWDVPAVTRELTPTIATRANVDEDKTGRIVSTWLEYASVRPKKRDITAAGINADDFTTTSDARTRLKFEAPEA